MPIRYDKLFALMKDKGLTTYRIRQDNIISQSALQSLREGESVTLDTIAALCKALDCQPGDILEYVDEDTEVPNEAKLRRECKKRNIVLKKSRIRNINIDDMGGYMMTDARSNFVIAGSRFDMSLEDVADWLKNATEADQ